MAFALATDTPTPARKSSARSGRVKLASSSLTSGQNILAVSRPRVTYHLTRAGSHLAPMDRA
eukprot:13087126-Alexandrium_andersonii.AAC.1